MLFHVGHHISEVLWDFLVEGIIELHVHLIEHFLVLLHDFVELLEVSMACSKISLGHLLRHVGNHSGIVEDSGLIGLVGLLLDVVECALENSALLSSENVEDEEGEEHEEVSIEHSLGDS